MINRNNQVSNHDYSCVFKIEDNGKAKLNFSWYPTSDSCFISRSFNLFYLNLSLEDTIHIDLESSQGSYLQHLEGAVISGYNFFNDSNWIKIIEINEDTTEICGPLYSVMKKMTPIQVDTDIVIITTENFRSVPWVE